MMPILGIATEKSQGRTTVTVPIAESLRAAGIIGAEVFTGKKVRDRVLPMHKKAWAAKFKKYAVLAGVNEPRKAAMGFAKRGPRSRLTPTAPRAR
jgi:molybdopterin-guanine dinucleotide biosynthesis protein